MRGSNPLSRSMNNKCKCGNEIHPVRIKYGYSNCVACSTVEKYGCAPVINHKTGNSIEILSRADAERIAICSRTFTYGDIVSPARDVCTTTCGRCPCTFPSALPSTAPSTVPSALPSVYPSNEPSLEPSTSPSSLPMSVPSSAKSYL